MTSKSVNMLDKKAMHSKADSPCGISAKSILRGAEFLSVFGNAKILRGCSVMKFRGHIKKGYVR
jgi:hypothetical protein